MYNPIVVAIFSIISLVGCSTNDANNGLWGTKLSNHQGHEYVLNDHLGQSISSRTDKPTVLTFMFTNCTDVCPIVTSKIKKAMNSLESQSEIDVHIISVDPHRDNRESRVSFMNKWDLPGNWVYLSGAQSELDLIWDAYFINPQKGEIVDSQKTLKSLFQEKYQVVHTSPIYIIDRTGKPRVIHTNPITTEHLAKDISIVSKW